MISPIVNNGMVARTQDISSLRQLDDNKSFGARIDIMQQIDTKEAANVRTVHHADDSGQADTHHDARQEGKNKYFDIRDKKKKKDDNTISDGKVTVKTTSGGFDFKV